MRSDIESMTKSGGGLPQFQNVTVRGLAIEREISTAAAPESVAEMVHAQAGRGPAAVAAAAAAESPSSAEDVPGGSHKMAGIVLVVIVALVAVLAVSYFAYKELWSSSAGSSAPAAPAVPAAGQSAAG